MITSGKSPETRRRPGKQRYSKLQRTGRVAVLSPVHVLNCGDMLWRAARLQRRSGDTRSQTHREHIESASAAIVTVCLDVALCVTEVQPKPFWRHHKMFYLR
jgi:hypothetical protein